MGFEPIKFLLERVYDLLKYESTILRVDEKTVIKGLQLELEEIEGYLQDMDEVERLAIVNHVLQTKVKHLRQIVPQIEDLLDKVADRNLQRIQPSFFKKSKVFIPSASNLIIQKHHLVKEIKRIRKKLNEIRNPEGYPLPNDNSQLPHKTKRQSNPNILDHEIIIGLQEDVDDLVAKFIRKEGERGADSAIVGMGGSSKTTLTSQFYNLVDKSFGKEDERGANLESGRAANLEDEHGANLAIVGMGGSGKTTLARQFYNHEEIIQAFPRRAWVCVSQQWKTEELLLQICAKLGVRLSGDERSIIRDKLAEFLHEQGSCLVVLDDVWEREALQDFLPTLLTGNGRVLITTRKEQIFQFSGLAPFHVHNMCRLTAKQSRELFSKIICNNKVVIVKFIEDEEEGEEDDFAKVGREMLKKCDGLPIAIITLAGVLGKKATIQDWKRIKDNVISIIMKAENYGPIGYEEVKKVLEFSYFDLPYYLKPCFLYLGTFKEDAVIYANTLINLWVDEGFVKPDQCPERTRLEELAKSFLEELVQRCMVQVVSIDYAGDVESIQIHDLMRDLCIDKAKELDFFRVFSSSTTSSTPIEPCPRVVIQIHRNKRQDSIVSEYHSRMRTLIWINEDDMIRSEQLFRFERLKHLRVLSLGRVDLRDSAEHICNMFLLRYLRFWFCRTGRLDFLKKLRNLQTFDSFGGEVELADDMFESMEQLRIISLIPYKSPSIISIGVDKLRNLQSLNVDVDEWIVKDLREAICSDLQQLRIHKIQRQAQLDAILCFVNRNTRLQTLALYMDSSSLLEYDLHKMDLERNCQHLKALELHGKIKKQQVGSRWWFPHSLLSLKLWLSRVEEEGDMNQLIAEVPHLMTLSLSPGSYMGAKLTMSGLLELHTLELLGLQSLKEWEITEGSMLKLQELRIRGCGKLEKIPDGITNIKTLQLLQVWYMPRRFCKRLEKGEEGESEKGEDFLLVQHIPSLTFEHIQD